VTWYYSYYEFFYPVDLLANLDELVFFQNSQKAELDSTRAKLEEAVRVDDEISKLKGSADFLSDSEIAKMSKKIKNIQNMLKAIEDLK